VDDEHWMCVYNTLVRKEGIKELNQFTIESNVPRSLSIYQSLCRDFTCVTEKTYHLTFILSMMRHRPTAEMPRVFSFLNIPSVKCPSSSDMDAAVFVFNKYVKPVSSSIERLQCVRDFASHLPSYDRKFTTEKFLLMQLPHNSFALLSRKLGMPIFAETNEIYMKYWNSKIKMSGKAFTELMKELTTKV